MSQRSGLQFDTFPARSRARAPKQYSRPGVPVNVVDFVFRTRLPYRLGFRMTTTVVEPPHRLEGRATGELVGIGRWNLTEEQGATRVRYDWSVKTTKSWMNFIAPLAKPFFKWNHDVIMRWGGEGLAKNLNCRLRWLPTTDFLSPPSHA